MVPPVPKPRRLAQVSTGKALPTPAGNSGSPLFRSPSGVGSFSAPRTGRISQDRIAARPEAAAAFFRNARFARACARPPLLPGVAVLNEVKGLCGISRVAGPSRSVDDGGCEACRRFVRANDRQKKGVERPPTFDPRLPQHAQWPALFHPGLRFRALPR